MKSLEIILRKRRHRQAAAAAARELVVSAVLDARRALATRGAPDSNLELELIPELLEHLAERDGQIDGQRDASRALGGRLATIAGTDKERRAALVEVFRLAARRLAPKGPPATGAGATAWQALLIAVDSLDGSGVSALGRLPFMSERVLELLIAEAAIQLPERPDTGRRLIGEPGTILGNVAVSRKLCEAIASALGFAVAPAYEAVYIYEPPGSHAAKVDTSDYEIVCHLILEHTLPGDGSEGSALVVHLPGAPSPARFSLRPGEAVALRGRGTIHSWDTLQADERRTLIAVGFQRAPA